jgi:hypothetical protein
MTRKLVTHLVVEAFVPRLINRFRCLTQAPLQLFLSIHMQSTAERSTRGSRRLMFRHASLKRRGTRSSIYEAIFSRKLDSDRASRTSE